MSDTGRPTGTKQHALARFTRRKVLLHLPDGAAESGRATSAAWALRHSLSRLLAHWPASLSQALQDTSNGYVVISSHPTAYHPGTWSEASGLALAAVAVLNASDLQTEPRRAATALACLVDHLLGSRLGTPVAMISAGATTSPAWADFPRRLLAAYQLAYDEQNARPRTPSQYFSWAFACYCLNRKQLMATDPLAYRLLHSTVFSEAFWRGHPIDAHPGAPDR